MHASGTAPGPLFTMFLTRPSNGRPGAPLRARHCRCLHPCPDIEGGCLCGFWVRSVVDRTWELHGPKKPRPHEGTGPLQFRQPVRPLELAA